ncbi:putative cob(II)yrinic acid a,c-diamide reductase [Candidatus Nitrososphaera gargensis Ga9.2]|uniref:Putative cob(II)yrinic acid a,c-diamide reductase n=1 Tax=Nitrososphaera gargensis (strain Ga9.2) TaxID=1237085 RepID=K0IHI6_NITGG|nr:5,6-dimethylbenzimidazole synthase [Candidatus Nitrososphaera gargensis]AFU59400.1 putative cob(II)yrinic acid a,c-diamide reductase [Candidatus Nitrososphaera gargensis Ga9.2]
MTAADSSNGSSLTGSEKEGLYKAIFSRRDVRSHFVDREIPDDVLLRILNAAHHAPSVGFSQPWNFILIKDRAIRQKVKESFLRERSRSISMLDGNKQRQKQYVSLKLEGILESAINICVTYDPTRFGPFVLGRTSIEETGVYSVACAIQNLWLAARAEGVGVGWVSILANEDLEKILAIPPHVKPIAYLCLGYVSEFAEKPDLERAGWLPRMDLASVVCYEQWGVHDSKSWSSLCAIMGKMSEGNREDNI